MFCFDWPAFASFKRQTNGKISQLLSSIAAAPL
jgi:hypothetical protein